MLNIQIIIQFKSSMSWVVMYYRYLLNNGAHPALVNSDGDTPFDIADDEEVQDLLQGAIDSQGNYYLDWIT